MSNPPSWLINPVTGEVVFWTSETGIDGQIPVDLDELDELCIDPLPSHVWYQDMTDFAEIVSTERTGPHGPQGTKPPLWRRLELASDLRR